MKTKSVILTSMLVLGVAHDAFAAAGTVIPQMVEIPAYATDTIPVGGYDTIPGTQIAVQPARLLSIKPTSPDGRAPVWDGTNGNFQTRRYDKTVDWRDGVPIWDDSISSYRQTDFSDWYLQPFPEIFLESDMATFAPDAENTNVIELYGDAPAAVEELLTPKRPTSTAPAEKYTAQDLTCAVTDAFGASDGCPFDTDAECDIWRRKPIVRESVSPRSPKIRAENMSAFIAAAKCDANITANDAAAAPLLARYKMLMKSSNACCTDGMVYALRNAGASDGLIYKFMSDDANFYNLGARCLMTTDAELDEKYPNTATAAVAADVRNGCLCRGRQWFTAMLAPFVDVYNAAPEFAESKFNYTYTDGLNREITVSINADVQNVLRQLAQCP